MGTLMNEKTASILFLVVCVAIASLLLAGMIAPLIGGGIFAAALVFFGGFSLAFRRRRKITEEMELGEKPNTEKK
jgi:hypothetical protein